MKHKINIKMLVENIMKSDLLGREKPLNQSRWIPCSERVPENAGETVMVSAKNHYNQKFVFTAFQGYDDLKWHTMDVGYMNRTRSGTEVSNAWEITHWMPMPEPPESKEDSDE